MKRNAENHLNEWVKRPRRKPLVLRGARQVGKTYLIENWAKKNFDAILKLDLERERDAHSIFKESDPQKILSQIALFKNQTIVPNRTLLFLDEIQACPQALASLRYFYELLPTVPVVAAGSLLDFALRDFAYSMPVGRIEFLYLYPLSFEEFLEATNASLLLEFLQTFQMNQALNETADQQLNESLRHYFFIGGMPEAVRAASEKASLLDIQQIQSSLLETTQDDFAKYGRRNNHDLLRKNLAYAAQNVGRKIKYTNISRDHSIREIKTAMGLLIQSRLIHSVHHTSANGLPLGAEKKEGHFKSIFLDIGLVNRLCGLSLLSPENLMTVNEGALAEQFIGQEMISQSPSFEDAALYYWHREAKNSNAEVDFLTTYNQDIYPIEVKSGHGNGIRSVKQFLLEKNKRKAIRFYKGIPALNQITLADKPNDTFQLLSLPLYFAGQLQRFLPSL